MTLFPTIDWIYGISWFTMNTTVNEVSYPSKDFCNNVYESLYWEIDNGLSAQMYTEVSMLIWIWLRRVA